MTDSKQSEIDAVVDQVMHDPEKRRAVRKALLERAAVKPGSKDKDEDGDALWDNLPV